MSNGSGIILFNKEGKILLQHRDKNAERHPNKWSFFGGRIEKGESPLEAVKRECLEELEYKLQNPKLILKKKAYDAHMFLFIEKYNPEKKLVLHEGDGMKWFDLKNLKSLDFIIPISQEVLEAIEKSINEQS